MYENQMLEAMLRIPKEGNAEIHADGTYRSEKQNTRPTGAGWVSIDPKNIEVLRL